MKWIRNILLAGMFIFTFYRLHRRALAFLLRLSPPKYRVTVDQRRHIPMHDGVLLAADLYHPTEPGSFPTILIRSPYGRNPQSTAYGVWLEFCAHRFAERGYHVVVQDVRGRFDSEGEFDPCVNEREDGKATLDWLSIQTWFNDVAGMWGSSYLGIIQWLVAAHAPQVKAFAPSITSVSLHSVLYPDGALDLGLVMRWLAILQLMDEDRGRWLTRELSFLRRVEQMVKRGFMHLPVIDCDETVLGQPVNYYRNWLEHPSIEDDVWQAELQKVRFDQITAPMHLVGGWHDFFLRPMLTDYAALRAAGQRPYLTIGPWHHFSPMLRLVDLRDSIRWFDAHLKNIPGTVREKPVRIYIMGAGEWREMDDWPPASQEQRYYLQPMGWLSSEPSSATEMTSRYCYDPADPTPALAGAQFGVLAGTNDNRLLEARADVLTFTSSPLTQDVEIIGAVKLELYVKSNLEYTDFFGRLCDVDLQGCSTNICDGLFRVEPGKGNLQPDGSLRIEVDMWSTAYRFRAGHSIRLQVSSGAHPRWTRNPGTGEPLTMGAALKVAEQTIYHDQEHLSAVVLPVARP